MTGLDVAVEVERVCSEDDGTISVSTTTIWVPSVCPPIR